MCCLVWLVVSGFSDISFNGLPSLFASMPWAAQLSGLFFLLVSSHLSCSLPSAAAWLSIVSLPG